MGAMIHYGIKCYKCHTNPIVGIRYKCLECESYDLCEECEAKYGKSHGHAFLKLRNTSQVDMFVKKLESDKQKQMNSTQPTFNCENSTLNFKVKNNNNFINIPVILSNNGNEKWPVPCYFACLEDLSVIKGEKVKINCTGEPGIRTNFNIKIDLSNINKAGEYASVWSLQDEKGDFFGPKVTFKVNDDFEDKLKLKPYYCVKKIDVGNEEIKPITTDELLAKTKKN
jgi:hypothetical protein